MKIIPKFQQGGIPSNYVEYTITLGPGSIFGAQDSNSSRKSSSDDSEKGKITEKDLISEKDLNVLPTDGDALAQIRTLMFRASSLGNGSSYNASSNRLILYMGMYTREANRAKFAKEQYDAALKNIQSKGGFDEIAISDRGVFVSNEDGKIEQVSVSDYLKNKDKYQPITNNNLLHFRAYNRQYAGDESIINIVNSGTGMEAVTKEILSRIGNLGTDTNKQSGYVLKAGKEVLKGLLLILDSEDLINQRGMTLDGIYKIESLTKTLKNQIKDALEYIYTSMTPEALTLLQVKGDDSKNPINGAYNIILQKLMSQTNETVEVSVNYQDKWDESGVRRDPNSKQSKEDEFKENVALSFLRGRGERTTINLVPGGNDAYRINATTMVLQDGNKKIMKGGFLDGLQASAFGGILDIKNASMGNGLKIIIPEQVQITDNHIRLVLFPTRDGVTPDISEINHEAKKQADEELKARGIDPNDEKQFKENYSIISETYAKHGMSNGNSLKYFAVLDGKANNNALGIGPVDNNPNFLESVSDSEFDAYEKAWNEEHSKDKNKAKLDLDKNNGWINPRDWFNNYDDVYKGLVWIPIMNSWALAQAGTGEIVKPSVANQEDINEFVSQQEERAKRSYNKPDFE